MVIIIDFKDTWDLKFNFKLKLNQIALSPGEERPLYHVPVHNFPKSQIMVRHKQLREKTNPFQLWARCNLHPEKGQGAAETQVQAEKQKSLYTDGSLKFLKRQNNFFYKAATFKN